jgi:hypothetical protein
MKKIVVALVFGVVSVLTSTAHGTMLTITDGEIFVGGLDTVGFFSGDGFEVSIQRPFTSAGFPGPIFGPASITVLLNGGGASVDGSTLNCIDPFSLDCGQITLFTSQGLPPLPDDWPRDLTFVSTAPFIAMGHLGVSDGFDLVGQGVLVGTIWCGLDCSYPSPSLRYEFSVPEPSTLLLLVAALVSLCSLHRLRDVRHRSDKKLRSK